MDPYEFSYAMGYELSRFMGGVAGAVQIVSLVLGLVGFIFGAIGLYAMAKRRCIPQAWMAWVPVLQAWVWGSISDQYRYVVKGQVKSKRKVLLVLQAIVSLLGVVTWIKLMGMLNNFGQAYYYGTEADVMAALMGGLLGLLGLAVALFVVAIVRTVIHYVAGYDLYTAASGRYGVVFLVLSIFFSFLEPYLVFFIRNQDDGMPPRSDITVEPVNTPEPWNLQCKAVKYTLRCVK